jgi:hypothetical protein
MAGTTLFDLSAITLTATAKAAAAIRGVKLADIMALAKTKALELSSLLRSIQAVHPSTGGDASNYASLTAIIAELA